MTDAFDLAAMIADREAGTPGKWEGRQVPGGMPSDVCDYGVISLDTGLEIARVWNLSDAYRIANIPAMEAEILRLRAELDTTRKQALQDAADACRARADMMEGVDMECCEGTANNCASDIEALMEALSHD